jgi:hypothetical protein
VSIEERPFQIALSLPEVCALIKWHSSQARAVARKLGQAQMTLQANGLTASGKNLKALHDAAKSRIDFHVGRGKGLLSLLPDRKGGAK